VLTSWVLRSLPWLSQGLLHSLNYFETVNQVLAKRASFGTEVMRLEGVVKPGTIERTSNGACVHPRGSGTNQVHVDAHGSPPQLFQANIPVVVVGHFTTRHSLDFDGTQIPGEAHSSYIAERIQSG